jgi:GNAT superfamily N-acetyltransferase
MPSYRIRPATADDVEVLIHHRVAMFTDMDVPLDRAALAAAFRQWVLRSMRDDVFRAWLAEDESGAIVGGGGITIIPWPPGPQYLNDRLAFVYNVYTELAHRRRGVARLLMDAIHAWCRDEGIGSIALNTSPAGRPLYESLGYKVTPNPMMFYAVQPVK